MKVGIIVEKEENEILFVKEGKEIFAMGSVYLGRKGDKKNNNIYFQLIKDVVFKMKLRRKIRKLIIHHDLICTINS